MKALWAGGIERLPNRRMLFNFITIGYVDNPGQPGETFFEQISKLPAACILRFSAGPHQLTVEKYWDLDPDNVTKTTDKDAVEQFTNYFTFRQQKAPK